MPTRITSYNVCYTKLLRVTHGDGTPFTNKIVTFEVTRSDGRLSPDGTGTGALILQARTDAQGFIRINAIRLKAHHRNNFV